MTERSDARYRPYADLSFWYGLSFFELTRMPAWAKRVYLEELERLKAEYMLLHAQAAALPYMKPSDARAFMRRLTAYARPSFSSPAARTSEEVIASATALGFGVKIEGPDGELIDAQ